MKLLRASILILALLLVACEEAVSPTEPLLVESAETSNLPGDANPGPEIAEPDERGEGDEPE